MFDSYKLSFLISLFIRWKQVLCMTGPEWAGTEENKVTHLSTLTLSQGGDEGGAHTATNTEQNIRKYLEIAGFSIVLARTLE